MSRRKARRPLPAHRPRLLTPEVEKRLIEATHAGLAVELAAEYAGISRSSFMVWMARGRDEMLAREAGETPDPDEDVYLELFEKVRSARANAALQAAVDIRRVSRGGIVTKVTTRKFRDPETGQIVEETTEDRTAPDWRAAAWYLERQHRQHFGKDADRLELEISAPGGESTGGQTPDDITALAERLSVSLGAVQYPPELEAGDDEEVQDAEVIE